MIKTLFVNNSYLQSKMPIVVFMTSGTFIVFSYMLFGDRQFTSLTLLFLYLFPWVLSCLIYLNNIALIKDYLTDFILMAIIIILGLFNVALSDNQYPSYLAMKLFIISGIIPLWTSMLLIFNDDGKKFYCYFSSAWLCIVIVVELLNYLISDRGFIVLNHAIPLGSLTILLLLGPLVLSFSAPKKMKICAIVLMISALTLIFITNKRGTFLALAGMILFWLYYRFIRLSLYSIFFLIISLIICYGGWTYYKSLNKNIPYHNSILHRFELYPFALHVYMKHPFFGTGLRAYSHENYLEDYRIKNKSLDTFGSTVKNLQTFDNMALTSFTELGGLMTLFYAALLIHIIIKYCRNCDPFARHNEQSLILLLPLLGLTIHSMTYDSLMFPQINWLIHVQLGILNGLATRPYR